MWLIFQKSNLISEISNMDKFIKEFCFYITTLPKKAVLSISRIIIFLRKINLQLRQIKENLNQKVESLLTLLWSNWENLHIWKEKLIAKYLGKKKMG